MAARKIKTPPVPATLPPVAVPDTATVLQSAFGHDLDPVDGQPMFADGMSRRRWLDATADDRHADLVAELRADPIPDDYGE